MSARCYNHVWTKDPEKTQWVRARYDEGLSMQQIALAAPPEWGLTKNKVVGHAHRNDFPSRPAPPGISVRVPWTPEELVILQANPHQTLVEIKPLLPNRSYKSIDSQRRADRHRAGGAPKYNHVVLQTKHNQAWKKPKEPTVSRPVTPFIPVQSRVFGSLHECQWPTNDGPNWQFCCEAVTPGRSYCDHHHSIAYMPAPRRHGADEPQFVLRRL